jgi:hypothetical protein
VEEEEAEGEGPTWHPSGLKVSELEEDDDTSSRTTPFSSLLFRRGRVFPRFLPIMIWLRMSLRDSGLNFSTHVRFKPMENEIPCPGTRLPDGLLVAAMLCGVLQIPESAYNVWSVLGTLYCGAQ